MENYTWPSFPYHNHCCLIPVQGKPICRHFITHPSLICIGTILAHPACAVKPLNPTRCLYLRSCPHSYDATCEKIKNLNESLDTTDIPVLARRESDGYYYRGSVIKAVEGEKNIFLVQFTEPSAVGEEDTINVQRTPSSDVLEYVTGMKHAILPSDKVLAPWEPGRKRYGPGTVLQGLETRDPLREKEDEEITVSFWNGKKAKVPLGVAMWISPLQWERIVEMIHLPYTSRKKFEGQFNRACYISPHPMLPPTHRHAFSDFQRFRWPCCPFVCPSFTCFGHTCSSLGCSQHASCCSLKCSGCWCQPSLAELAQGDVKEESGCKPTTQLLAVEGPPKAEPAVALSGSSSSSRDSPRDKGTCVIKNTMVDHAVNTDYSLFDKPKQQEVKRPDWKYWKRSHPSSPFKSQGRQHFP
nr:uncharacterized protein C11orf16 homolog [Pogona vitticeps]